jgi:hypothetical protein
VVTDVEGSGTENETMALETESPAEHTQPAPEGSVVDPPGH